MRCGCFCCLQAFEPAEVIDWIDDGETPVCPYCGVAAVLPGVTDFVELYRLHQRRYGAGTGTLLPGEEP
jgi:NAD-dependent SIR2 family protein deacetylase